MRIPNGTPPQITFKCAAGISLFKKHKNVLNGQETSLKELKYIRGKYGQN